MAALNEEKIKKLLRGEKVGTCALIACGVILIFFIAGFCIAQVLDLPALRLTALILSPVLIAISAAVAAYCNIRFGGAIDRAIQDYVLEVLVENAGLMRPDRESLTFTLFPNGTKVEIKVNNYKERITFDFSAFGKLSPMRKVSVLSAIESKLSDAFCRLVAERGAKYASVHYIEHTDKKNSKPVPVIENGIPDRKALKNYYKNR